MTSRLVFTAARHAGSSERSSTRAEPSMKASSEPIGCARDFPDARSFLRTRARVTLLRLGRGLPCLPGIVRLSKTFQVAPLLEGPDSEYIAHRTKKAPAARSSRRACPNVRQLPNKRTKPAGGCRRQRTGRKEEMLWIRGIRTGTSIANRSPQGRYP